MIKQNRLYNIDARKLLTEIKEPIVDLIITSPPYFDLKDYGTESQIGFGQNYQTEYLTSLKNVFFQCYTVTKQTGSMWIVVDTFKKNGNVKLLRFDIANICSECGWILRDIIVWDKGKTLPWSRKGQFRNRFEYILFFTKSNDYKYYVDRIKDPYDLKEWWVKYPERYSQKGKNPGNIWEIQIPVQGSWSTKNFHHFCPFPTELVEKILLLSSDKKDLVLDPFAGSGVVLAQASFMKRKYIGFEINPKYIDMFKKIVVPMELESNKQKKKNNLIEQKRKELEKNITALRALKYPKIIMKSLKEQNKNLSKEVLGAYVEIINKPISNSNKFAFLSILIIVENSDHLFDIEEKLKSISAKPPLSKYGLETEIKIVPRPKLIANPHLYIKSKKLYLYNNGKAHYYDKKIKYSDLKNIYNEVSLGETKRYKYPPVLSSISIRQEILKTWKPQIYEEKKIGQ